MIAVRAIGWRAHAALARSAGEARVIARTSSSTWLLADGDVLWLGAGEVLHPRAIVAAGDLAGDVARLDTATTRPWRPATPVANPHTARNAVAAARRRSRALDAIGRPDGLARLLGGTLPQDDVSTRAEAPVAALAAACRADRAADAVAPAIELLGLGMGLTPSGDDLVGGVVLARRWLAAAGAADTAGWRAAAEAIRGAARDRTHRISAALLDDLLDGDTYAPLHEVLAAFAAGTDDGDAVRGLTRLGHSSGWDMLAGLLVGLVSGIQTAPSGHG